MKRQLWKRAAESVAVLLSVMAFCAVSSATAAPFDRDFTAKQPDGTIITYHGSGGDFYGRYYYNGYSIIYDPVLSGWVYGVLSEDGTRLESSGALTGVDDVPDFIVPDEESYLTDEARQEIIAQRRAERAQYSISSEENWKSAKAERREAAQKRLSSLGADSPKLARLDPNEGEILGVALLIEFPDEKHADNFSAEEIENLMNGEDGYTKYGNTYSMRSYYSTVSNGKVDYSNTVVPYFIEVPNPKSYYNSLENGAITFMQDVLAKAKAMAQEDPLGFGASLLNAFEKASRKERKKSGKTAECIRALNLVYAGEPNVDWATGLWPATWFMGEIHSMSAAGVEVNIERFMVSNMTNDPEVYTLCHENGHMVFDFPDFYTYDGNSTGGAGLFCLMSSRNRYSDKHPQMINGYLRYIMGWTEPQFINPYAAATNEIYSSAEGMDKQNIVYVYENPTTGAAGLATEYYLLENRQWDGIDYAIPARGVAIWHVDELGNRDASNVESNKEHNNYELTLMQADGKWDFENNVNDGDRYDLWYEGNSAAKYINYFGPGSEPSSKWWAGNDSRLRLANFSAPDSTMTFEVIPFEPTIARVAIPNGRVGTWYSDTLKAVDTYDENNTWLAETELPAGLIIDETTGVISGYPREAGTFSVTIRVNTSMGATTVKTFELTILDRFDAPYEQDFHTNVFDAVEDYGGWSNFELDGDFTSATSSLINEETTERQSLLWRVKSGKLVYQSDADYRGKASVAWAIQPILDISSFRRPVVSFDLVKPDKNSQLNIYLRRSPDSGWSSAVTNITEIVSKSTTITIDLTETILSGATDAHIGLQGIFASGGAGITIDNFRVYDAAAGLAIAEAELPQATTDVEYSHTFEAAGGIEPYIWQVEGELPAGMTFEGGVLSGTATEPGEYGFTVSITDDNGDGITASQTFSLTVDYPYNAVWTENFEHHNAAFPDGWKREKDNGVNWEIAPQEKEIVDGIYPVTAQEGAYYAYLFWSDLSSAERPDHKARLISPLVNLGDGLTRLALTFQLCMRGRSNDPLAKYDQDELRVYFRQNESAAWGEPIATYTNSVDEWTLQRVELPMFEKGQICFEGNAKFGWSVALDDIRINDVTPGPSIVTAPVLLEGYPTVAWTNAVSATGGTGEYTWSATGLPAGFEIDEETGTIGGTATVPGTYHPVVTVVDEEGLSATKTFTLLIHKGQKISEFVGTFDEGMTWEAWQYDSGWSFTNGSYIGTAIGLKKAYPSAAYEGETNAVFYSEKTKVAKGSLTLPPLDLNGASNVVLRLWAYNKAANAKTADGQRQNGNFELQFKPSADAAYETLSFHEVESEEELTKSPIDIDGWTQYEAVLPEGTEISFVRIYAEIRKSYGVCIDDITLEGAYTNKVSVYQQWKEDNGFGEAEDDDDSDGDGLTLEQEFVFGADPNAADGEAALLYGYIEENNYYVTFREGAKAVEAGVVWHLEWTTDLTDSSSWSEENVETISTELDEGGAWYAVVCKHADSDVTENPQRFFRLRAEMPAEE